MQAAVHFIIFTFTNDCYHPATLALWLFGNYPMFDFKGLYMQFNLLQERILKILKKLELQEEMF